MPGRATHVACGSVSETSLGVLRRWPPSREPSSSPPRSSSAAGGIEGYEVLANRMGRLFCLRPCNWLIARHSLLLVHIRLDQARINRERLAPDQSGRDAHPHHTLEDPAQGIAFTEAFLSRTAEHRVVRHLVFDTELAEPA